jgi:hypothetical protein
MMDVQNLRKEMYELRAWVSHAVIVLDWLVAKADTAETDIPETDADESAETGVPLHVENALYGMRRALDELRTMLP